MLPNSQDPGAPGGVGIALQLSPDIPWGAGRQAPSGSVAGRAPEASLAWPPVSRGPCSNAGTLKYPQLMDS